MSSRCHRGFTHDKHAHTTAGRKGILGEEKLPENFYLFVLLFRLLQLSLQYIVNPESMKFHLYALPIYLLLFFYFSFKKLFLLLKKLVNKKTHTPKLTSPKQPIQLECTYNGSCVAFSYSSMPYIKARLL